MLTIEETEPDLLSASEKENRARYRPERPVYLDQAKLHQLRELIETVWLGDCNPPPQVQKMVDKAHRVGNDFSARLAIRALRLEQALIDCHERIIRLEWNLAQSGKPAQAGQ